MFAAMYAVSKTLQAVDFLIQQLNDEIDDRMATAMKHNEESETRPSTADWDVIYCKRDLDKELIELLTNVKATLPAPIWTYRKRLTEEQRVKCYEQLQPFVAQFIVAAEYKQKPDVAQNYRSVYWYLVTQINTYYWTIGSTKFDENFFPGSGRTKLQVTIHGDKAARSDADAGVDIFKPQSELALVPSVASSDAELDVPDFMKRQLGPAPA